MRALRKLLLPFSLIYSGILRIRHFIYDTGVKESYRPLQQTIVLGNLALGGTGKTPMTLYFLNRLDAGTTAVLSRGYGRKTKGTFVVEASSTPEECGDEPLMIKQRHPEVMVLVDENRKRGLGYLAENHPEIKTVLLDDAYQHRKITADRYLLLTTYGMPYSSDQLLPAGNLRDLKMRRKAADAIVVTKCPADLKKTEKANLARELSASPDQKIFFAHLTYDEPKPLFANDGLSLTGGREVILLSGIAQPHVFEKQAAQDFQVIKHFIFKDHHPFKREDLFKLRDFIDTFEGAKPAVITTEKDAMRLSKFADWFEENEIEIWFWPIRMNFGTETESFDQLIQKYARKS